MSWPLSQDYNEAIQSPAARFADPDLRRARAAVNALGIPLPCSGNFADVYQLIGPDGSRWAVKCFTRETPGLRERYAEISRHLRRVKLPFTVDFDFLAQGIRVGAQWFPVLKMQWVEGLTLNQFVARAADKPATLEALLSVWARLARRLREAEVAHGDLQHGNVLLVPDPGAASLSLKLVDYDGMWVPALAGSKSGEVGHPSYQHPQRLREETYGPEVDRFPLLLIATALSALKRGGRALWEKYDNGDNLLFTQTDLEAPSKSRLLLELMRSSDPTTAALAHRLIDSLRDRAESAPLLEEVMPELYPAPAGQSAPVVVGATPTPDAAPAAGTAGASDEAAAETTSSDQWPEPAEPSVGQARLRPWMAGVAALVAVVVVLGGVAGAVYFATGAGSGRPATSPPLARERPPGGTKPTKRAPDGDSRSGSSAPASPGDGDPGRSQEPGKKHPSFFVTSAATHRILRYDGFTGEFRGAFNPVSKSELSGPYGLALHGDDLYIASHMTSSVVRFNARTGDFLGTFVPPGGGGLKNPRGIAFGPDGHLYVCDPVASSVKRYDGKTGHFIDDVVKRGEAGLGGPCGLAFGSDNRLFVTSPATNSVICCDPGRKNSATTFVKVDGTSLNVSSLVFGPDGDLYIGTMGDGLIRRYDGHTGKYKEVFARPAPDGVERLGGLAFGPDGNLYVHGIDSNNVLCYDGKTGMLVRTFVAPGAGGLKEPGYTLFAAD